MKELKFVPSQELTIGTEIELQLLDSRTGNLTPKGPLLLAQINKFKHQGEIKPEVTDSMIELNSSVHQKIDTLKGELHNINQFLVEEAKKIHILLSGGGTHPFQEWNKHLISKSHEPIYKAYDFLIKKYTVFGQHIHIGCSSPNQAIYLIHAFSRYIPHLIALSASSPFYEGVETAFHSTRLHVVDAFPLSGHFPLIETWDELMNYLEKFRNLHIATTMESFFWDIRLRPQFGTIELRVCDSPLTLSQSIALTAYAQTLALYCLEQLPIKIDSDTYLAYEYNRFQASRYGLEGKIAVPTRGTPIPIYKDILNTLKKLSPYAKELGTVPYLKFIKKNALTLNNSANKIKKAYAKCPNMHKLIKFQSKLWMSKENC